MIRKLLFNTLAIAALIFSFSNTSAQTWDTISTPVETNLILFDMSFPDGQSAVGYMGGSNYTYNGQGKVLKTIDGGLTWDVEWESTSNGTGIMSIYFRTTMVGFAGTMGGDLMKTIDGGTTWSSTDIDENLDQGEIGDIEFYDDDNGAIVTSWNGIYITSDGGDTWTVASTNYLGCHEISYGDADNVYGVGGEQKIYKSTDGGDTWAWSFTGPQSVNQWYNLGVDFVDANHGAVSSEEGMMFFTEDGGDTWTTETIVGQNGLMNDVFMVNQNYLYVAATPAEIFVSTNGGETYTSEYYNFDPSMYKVRILEDGVGIACGSGANGGTILRKLPTTIGIEEYTLESMDVYPNPSSDYLNIDFELQNNEVLDFTIINSLGKLVHKESISSAKGLNTTQINLSNWSEGNYILSISKGKQKVVNEHFQIIR